MNQEALLTLAEKYLANGFLCFPIKPPNEADGKSSGKIPAVREWQKNLLKPEEFRRALKPGGNLGVAMGGPSWIVAVDIDPRNGGLAWYQENEARLGMAVKETTRDGGFHLYYNLPPAIAEWSFRSPAPGVDILSLGRYVVTAPSIHACGAQYRFENGLTLLDVANEADFLPEWLHEFGQLSKVCTPLEAPTVPQNGHLVVGDPDAAIEALRAYPPAVSGQSGNQTTYRAGCLCRDFGLTETEAFGAMRDVYNPRCQPPWELGELRQIVGHSYRYANGTPGGALAVSQFSTEPVNGMNKVDQGFEKKQMKTNSLVITDSEDFLAEILPPVEYLMGPFRKQGLAQIYAPPGIGKTFFCLGLACSIAKGCDFLRWRCEHKARVLYVDGEMTQNDMQERLLKLSKITGRPERGQLKIITPDKQNDWLMPDICTKEGQSLLEPAIAESDFIVLDNLSALARTGKENEAESWLPVQGWLLRLRRQGKSVVFVHHAGKGEGQTARGTSKREDALDLNIKLIQPKGYESERGCMFEGKFVKARAWKRAADVKAFTAELIDTDCGLTWKTGTLEESNEERVRELAAMGLSKKQIAEEADLSLRTINRINSKLSLNLPDTRMGRPAKEFESTNIF